MKNISAIATGVFDKIRSRFDDIQIEDEEAKPTQNEEDARFFKFNYISQNGENFGPVEISIVNENDLKIYFSKNITEKLDDGQKKEWYSFLRNIRMFAKRQLLTFDVRDISRSNLDKKSVVQTAIGDATFDKSDVNEGKFYGTKKRSYQDIGRGKPVKLSIRHTSPVNEEERGARSRHIDSIFVETAEGERFKLPFTNLPGARAMGNHIAHGGQVHDDVGNHISQLVQKMHAMRKFIRAARNKTFEGEDAESMTESAIAEYGDTRAELNRLKGPKGYKQFVEAFEPEVNEEVDITELKDKFTRRVFDERLEEALPHVYRAHAKRTKAIEEERVKDRNGGYVDLHTGVKYRGPTGQDGNDSYMTPEYMLDHYQKRLAQIEAGPHKYPREVARIKNRIAKLSRQHTEVKEADEFEDYMNQAAPNDGVEVNPADESELREILSAELPVGPDGVNAAAIVDKYLTHLDTTELLDALYSLSEVSPDSDAAQVIKDWIQTHDPELWTELGLEEQQPEQAPPQPDTTSQQPAQESFDPLSEMKRLLNIS